ncbi:hypothetical protein AB0D57_07245 [Streptomyces sp. NPDC048275]|uniref:hypothetical protein n=1 Tax=Streptomyces sp. NPDC048275 TaxID=3155629 RepID=UPI0033D45819
MGSWVGIWPAGAGELGGPGGVVRLLVAGGGASGTVGDDGESGAAKWSGSATRAATAQVKAAPVAARSRRRRDAARRIVS